MCGRVETTIRKWLYIESPNFDYPWDNIDVRNILNSVEDDITDIEVQYVVCDYLMCVSTHTEDWSDKLYAYWD